MIDALLCGECGGENFRLAHQAETPGQRVGGQGSAGFRGIIVATCVKCGSDTEISAVPARLTTSGTLYQTREFEREFEHQARTNLRESLERLRGKP